jgi:glycosyltransferase involved in cell wall biosynthesis
MKILIVAESIDIEDSSGSKANVAMIKSLSQAGFLLKVMHYTRKEIQLEGINCTAIPENRRSFFFFLSRFQRLFSRATGIQLHRFLESLFGFSFTFFNDTNSIAEALKKKTDFVPDLIITLSKGASFRPHYALLKCTTLHGKWLAYVHDPYPFHYYPRPYNWVEPGFQKKENFFRDVSEKAAFSAFPSLLLKEWMGSYFPNFLKTGVVIPHQSVPYEIKEETFSFDFDPLKFTILHAGSLMKQRSPEALLQGFQLFLEQNPEARRHSQLYLLGPADYHTGLLEQYKDHKNIWIENKGIPFATVYNLQMNVSVNVILESKSEISPFLPAKFPHCIEAGKPILLLSPFYSETKRLLGNDYPFWCEVDDSEKIAIYLKTLYTQWVTKQIFGLSALSYLKYYLGPENIKITLQNLIEK